MTAHSASLHDGAEHDLASDELCAADAPAPHRSVIAKRLGDDVLVVDARNGRMHVLNSSAALVWECLDPELSLGELASELSEVFGVEREAMEADVVSIARDFGERGLLEGVSRGAPGTAQPARLSPGARLSPFAVATGGGEPGVLPRPGRSTLLVNWSPYCGYCTMIAPALAGLRAELAERGVELALLTTGSPEDNLAMLASPELADVLWYRGAGGEAAGSDPFLLMGTPVAYLVDAAGILGADLATGAGEVPRLARKAAGLPAEEEPDNGLVAASGICGPSLGAAPGRPARVWARTSVYRIGELEVGVRADSSSSDQILAELFAAYRLDGDAAAPANFSVVLARAGAPGGAGSRELGLLLAGDRTVLRSRSPRRVVEALAAWLSDAATAVPAGLVRTNNVAAVRDGTAVLLPGGAWRRIEKLQARLARIGFALSDAPVLVDPAAGELVVPEPGVVVDRAALERLGPVEPGRSELAGPPPGRYLLRLWLLDEAAPGRAGDGLGTAATIAGALPSVEATAESLPEVIDALELGFKSIPTAILPLEPLEELVEGLQALTGSP